MNTNDIFKIKTEQDFDALALKIYKYQAQNCQPYKLYHQHLNINIDDVTDIKKIPFLPIEFFKKYTVLDVTKQVATTFTSSGTTGTETSKHYVADIDLYSRSFTKAFQLFYGGVKDYCILALLPNYLERTGSSLVYMVDYLIKESNSNVSGFYLNNLDELNSRILENESKKQKTILIGVSYALLDLVEKFTYNLQHTIVMETGGMKGKRKEMVKEEMHEILCNKFGIDAIHSEYGMTELLSQAYSFGAGIFSCPPWMKILIRDVNDPFSFLKNNFSGGINVIDLANMYSCSFIATQDLGRTFSNNTFEVLGRFDNSNLRGCNLLIQ